MPIESLSMMAYKYGGLYHNLARMEDLAIEASKETDKNKRKRIDRKLIKEEKDFYNKLGKEMRKKR